MLSLNLPAHNIEMIMNNLSFSQKNDLVVKYKDGKYFGRDLELFKKHCSANRLMNDLSRANAFTYDRLDSQMLYLLLDKISIEEILNNRKGKEAVSLNPPVNNPDPADPPVNDPDSDNPPVNDPDPDNPPVNNPDSSDPPVTDPEADVNKNLMKENFLKRISELEKEKEVYDSEITELRSKLADNTFPDAKLEYHISKLEKRVVKSKKKQNRKSSRK